MTQLEDGGAWTWTHSLPLALILNHWTIQVEFLLSSEMPGSPTLGMHEGGTGPRSEWQSMWQGWSDGWGPCGAYCQVPGRESNHVSICRGWTDRQKPSISYRWETKSHWLWEGASAPLPLPPTTSLFILLRDQCPSFQWLVSDFPASPWLQSNYPSETSILEKKKERENPPPLCFLSFLQGYKWAAKFS